MTVTCHTSGCGNEGVAVDVPDPSTVTDIEGNPYPPPTYVCGACGQPIEDTNE